MIYKTFYQRLYISFCLLQAMDNQGRHRSISEISLGQLEQEIMNVLWQEKQARVREIYDKVKKKTKIAHTSVAVLLDRMHEKKVVSRRIETCKGGYRYIYCPVSDKEELQHAMLQGAVDRLIDKFGESATAYFNQRFGKKK